MLDKDLILRQLDAMSSEDIALLVRDSLIESNVEFSYGDTGIVFDSLSSWDHFQIKFSTGSMASGISNLHSGYCSSTLKDGRSTMFQADTGATAFGPNRHTAVAA